MRSLVIALALAAALVNPVFALSVDKQSQVILKGKLVAEWVDDGTFNQVYHYKGNFYRCAFLAPYKISKPTTIHCYEAFIKKTR